MSISIVAPNGTWLAPPDANFDLKFSDKDGDNTFEIKRNEEGGAEGNITLSSIDIGTKDNHITLGGGSQEGIKFNNGRLIYGKTTVNVLGGSFDLGDGRTENFQFSFTAEITSLGVQWTGVATNELVEEHKMEVNSQLPTTLSKKSEVPLLEKKDPFFDDAGILIPESVFLDWAVRVQLSVELEASVDNKEATVKVTRGLKVEIRPNFMPLPGRKKSSPPPPSQPWPKQPHADPIKIPSPGERPGPGMSSPPGEPPETQIPVSTRPAQPPLQASRHLQINLRSQVNSHLPASRRLMGMVQVRGTSRTDLNPTCLHLRRFQITKR
jgi:hypothetical protein